MPLSMEYIIKKNKHEISQRKREGLAKLAKIIQTGRKQPLWFVREFLGIERRKPFKLNY